MSWRFTSKLHILLRKLKILLFRIMLMGQRFKSVYRWSDDFQGIAVWSASSKFQGKKPRRISAFNVSTKVHLKRSSLLISRAELGLIHVFDNLTHCQTSTWPGLFLLARSIPKISRNPRERSHWMEERGSSQITW